MERWPHQVYALQQFLAEVARGHRRIILQSPTGGGKGQIIEDAISHYLGMLEQVALYLNRKILIDQSARNLVQSGIEFGIRAAGHQDAWEQPVQVASMQTQARRIESLPLHQAKLVIIDECFTGETEILTPTGPRRIDHMSVGDTAYNGNGIGVVTGISCRLSNDLFLIEASDGTTTTVTGNHRFFTESGWVQAKNLARGQSLSHPEAVRSMWENVRPNEVKEKRETFLHAGTKLEQANVLLSILCEEIEEPDAQNKVPTTNDRKTKRNKTQTAQAWRERAIASLASACIVARTWGGLGVGSSGANGSESKRRNRISKQLQNRHCQSSKEDRNRIGREKSHSHGKKVPRRQENGTAGDVRVVRVSRIESKSPRPVFNLQISGHPSYFANGHLVHNCHMGEMKGKRAKAIIKKHLEMGAVILMVTATPLDMQDMADVLIQAGTNSELRACGALVPAIHYGASEPDFKAIKKMPPPGEQLSEAEVSKAIMTVNIFGLVFEKWKLHNPGQRPTLLFAPGVEQSIGFAKDFWNRGISTAHIDGKNAWINGEFFETSPEIRDKIFKMHRDGKIQVICSCYVMREGVNLPWVECLIFATIVTSLKAYLQMGGRGLRASPSTGKTCLIRGTLVLTDKGEIPIEQITLDHRVWDGCNYVRHGGAICRGVKPVIHYDGITATPDHEVMTDAGWKKLAEASHRQIRITRSGIGGTPIRTTDNNFEENRRKDVPVESRGSMLELPDDIYGEVSQHAAKTGYESLSEMYSENSNQSPKMDLHEVPRSKRTVLESKLNQLLPIWRERDQIQFRECESGRSMGDGELGDTKEQENGIRQDRQRRSLRAREFEMGDTSYPNEQHKEARCTRTVPCVQKEIPSCNVFGHDIAKTFETDDGRRDFEEMGETFVQAEGEVWDILDAGPLHRFTANGRLVHNCLTVIDHGGHWWRLGSLNIDRKWYLNWTSTAAMAMREEQLRSKKCVECRGQLGDGPKCPHCGHINEIEPYRCPKCEKILNGRSCGCGFTIPIGRRSRVVVQQDGTMVEHYGDIFTPIHKQITQAEADEKKWEKAFYQAKNSKSKMTFAQAIAFFAANNGWKWPSENFKLMPKYLADKFRRVADVPRDRLK